MINKVVLVFDSGSFIEVAIRLSREFKKVKYFVPWVGNGFPKSIGAMIGEGAEGIERVEYFWNELKDVDLVVFTDVYYSDIQAQLKRMEIPVWGMAGAESLELDRWGTRELMESLSMPTPETKVIKGVDKLDDYLKKHEDLYIKISKFRGDMETFHHEKFFMSEPFFENLEASLGKQADIVPFLVEKGIEGVEIGADMWTVDGKFPETAMWGYEIKDMGYIGCIRPYSEFPKQLKWINDKLSPTFKKEGSRGSFSTEVRIGKDKIPYLIDFTARFGSPPSEVQMECYKNIGEVIWEGANGVLVEPKPTAKYAVEAMMYSDWADGHWTPVDFPKENRQWIKFKNLCVLDGKHYTLPLNTGHSEMGAVVGIGDSIEEAMEKVEETAKSIKSYDVDIHIESFDKALQVIKEGEDLGITF